MMFGGNNMGRVGGGGGNLLRSVGRSVARANLPGGGGGTHLQEPISSSSSSSNNSRSSNSSNSNNNNNHLYATSPFASCNVPVSTVHGLSTWRRCDEPDWVTVEDGHEFELGPVPSQVEVHSAISALQQVFTNDFYYNAVRDEFGSGSGFDNYRDEERPVFSPADFTPHISPPESEMDWIEPSFGTCGSKAVLRSHGGLERVHEALRLLRTEPLVQKMVKSLSSDEGVWNAVLNNEVVRELRDSLSSSSEDIDEESKPNSDEESTNIVKLVFDGTRAKIAEVVEKIAKLVSDLFQPPPEKGHSDDFIEKLRTSFMLSIMVLLVVVVARANKA